MTDNHVHMGWYTDGYHSPSEVWKAVREAGICEIAVSSTSTCAERYKLVEREMLDMIRLGGSHIHPVLWLTPKMMRSWGIRYLLRSKIRWQGVKLHWFAHREWCCNRKLLSQAVELARKLKVPLLLHTGEDDICSASIFEPLCLANHDLTIVLAHGRPLEPTKQVLSHCSNVYVDTAFMPVGDVVSLVNDGFNDRILFGSDAPINQIFANGLTTSDCIKNQIEELRAILQEKYFDAIMHRCPYNQN